MSRQAPAEQWEAIIDLAIEIAEGIAGWRHARNSITRERYWFFRGGWWLLTTRHERRARLIIATATTATLHAAGHRGTIGAEQRQIIHRLRLWKKSGRWVKIAARIPPLYRPENPMRTVGKGKQKKKFPILP